MKRAELQRLGLHGFSDEDYAEFLRRKTAVREDIQRHEVALQKMTEVGATERKGMTEAGLGKRQRAKFGFEGPGERARTRGDVATAEGAEYELGFAKDVEPTLRKMVKQKEKLTGLDIKVLEAELAKLGEVPKKEEIAKPAAVAPGVAKPRRRKLRPSIKRFMWEGTPTGTGLRLPGLLAPAYGYKNIADWLGFAAKKGFEYAYPRSK